MDHLDSRLVIDPVLLRKYVAGGAQFATYPAACQFVEAFGAPQLGQWLAKRNIGGFALALSVYVNSPQILSDFTHLEKELRVVGGLLGNDGRVSRMRWGGGAMASSARANVAETMRLFGSRFETDPRADIAIEVDPGSCEHGYMEFLAALGFNSFSADYRGEEETQRVIQEARASGFRSVSLHLVYGAPHQTLDSLSGTLEQIVAFQPERIELAPYASAPATEQALQGFTLAVGRIARAGYNCVGIDRFERDAGSNAMQPESDTLAFGSAAIGRIGPTYYQNFQRPDDYRAALGESRLPVQRGIELTADDLLRRSVIHSLTSNFRLSIESIEIAHLIDFKTYFWEEQAELRDLEADGLIESEPDWIVVTPRGRLLVRAIGAVFDKYLRARRRMAAMSRVL